MATQERLWPSSQDVMDVGDALHNGITPLDELMARLRRDVVDLEPDASLHEDAPRPELAHVGCLAMLVGRVEEERAVLDAYLDELRQIVRVGAQEAEAEEKAIRDGLIEWAAQ